MVSNVLDEVFNPMLEWVMIDLCMELNTASKESETHLTYFISWK